MQAPHNRESAFITRALIIALIAALFFLAWHLRRLFLLVFAALLVAVILQLVARPLHERFKLPYKGALAVAVMLAAAVLALAFGLFRSEVADQTQALSSSIPRALQSLQARMDSWGLGNLSRFWTGEAALEQSVTASAGRFARSLASGITDTLLVLAGGIYIAAQPRLYRTGLVKLVPAARRDLISDALDESGEALALWLKGRLVSMALVGILTGLGLWALGVPSALSLALLSALLEFIPFLGPILASVPAILLGLAHSPQTALWTALLYLLVQQLEGNVIEPIVQQHAVTIPPALLLFGLVAAAMLFGIVGVLLGAPLTVVAYVLVKRLYVREALGTETRLPTEKLE